MCQSHLELINRDAQDDYVFPQNSKNKGLQFQLASTVLLASKFFWYPHRCLSGNFLSNPHNTLTDVIAIACGKPSRKPLGAPSPLLTIGQGWMTSSQEQPQLLLLKTTKIYFQKPHSMASTPFLHYFLYIFIPSHFMCLKNNTHTQRAQTRVPFPGMNK